MYKNTIILYPHIVKQYESLEQFVTDNGYEDYAATHRGHITEFGFETTDSSRYMEALSDDGFEVKITIAFDSEDDYNEKMALLEGRQFTGKKPIFEEEFRGESTEHLF